MVLDALNELDSDTRAEMLEDIVVVGGSAHLDGLGDRLEEDLKVRADYSSSTESTPAVVSGGHRCVSLLMLLLYLVRRGAVACGVVVVVGVIPLMLFRWFTSGNE